jgi:hypothetical protein
MSKTTTKKIIEETTAAKMNEEINNTNEFPSEPGQHVINNILNFSKALSVKKLKNEAYVELVLN